MGIYLERTVYECIPTGEYRATVGAVEQETGDFGPQIKFRFDLQSPDYEDKSLIGWASAKFSGKSKLFQWTSAILGRALAPDEGFDSDKLLGRRCILIVTTEHKDDGSEYNKVHGLKAAGQARSNGRQAQHAQQPAIAAPAVDMGPSREPSDAEDPGDSEEPLW